MILRFKSTYGKDNEKNIIEFKAKLEKFEENNLNVLLFEENREGKIIKTRIEYNEKMVNIYTGPSTLSLELDKKIKNLFKTGASNIEVYIWTYLKSIKIDSNKVAFDYNVSSHEDFENENHFLLELEWN